MPIVKMGDVRALNPIYYGGSPPDTRCGLGFFAPQHQSDREMTGDPYGFRKMSMTSDGLYAAAAVPFPVANNAGYTYYCGYVSIYKNTAGTWAHLTDLLIPDNVAYDNKGWPSSVGISDDLTVACCGEGDTGIGVLVYESTGTDTWDTGNRYDLTVIPTSNAVQDVIISRDGQTVFGALEAPGGAIACFRKGIGTWTHNSYIKDGSEGDSVFGIACTPDGTTVAVNVLLAAGTDTAGQVFVTGDFLSWTLQQTIGPITGTSNPGSFSQGVAITADANTLVLGTISDTLGVSSPNHLGSLYIYKLISGTYTQTALLHQSAAQPPYNQYTQVGGQIFISDDGESIIANGPGWSENNEGFAYGCGAVYAIFCAQALSGTLEIDDYQIFNPYWFDPAAAGFGLSLCCDATADNIGAYGGRMGYPTADLARLDFFTTAGSIFFDQFTGSGAASSHTADTGQTWSINTDNIIVASPTDLSLSGGKLLAPGAGDEGEIITTATSSAHHVINALVVIDQTAGVSELHIFDRFSTGLAFKGASILVSGGNVEFRMTPTVGPVTVAATNGFHLLTFEVSDTAQSLSWDGTVQLTDTASLGALTGTSLVVALHNNPGDGPCIVVDQLSLYYV